jgi:hypothetical protein
MLRDFAEYAQFYILRDVWLTVMIIVLYLKIVCRLENMWMIIWDTLTGCFFLSFRTGGEDPG